ncbi:phosphate acyltransferase PlsX [Solwaraspora sp. WMMD791]|uniref:phosphate acyltransferase PlsX n=1 Tax=Solwaraspora sp. WMMD791 TaxID=3016086 RepID=UPI00249A0CC6|nr:phosphate acyltransferase PlsX [Solwaraspora sp. WMMD791]WFE30811.1 phosphate acyltransferase PlsX [Solwaraspora sp. WMMD791]
MDPGTSRIAVDLLGGDGSPAVVVDGALRACRADPDLHLLLVGPPDVADEVRAALPTGQRHRITVRPIAAVGRSGRDGAGRPDAAPTHPVRPGARPGSTIAASVAAVADGTADAVVSAGSSGEIVTAAALGLGRWPTVRRPALVAVVPAVAGPVVLLDVGASVEARPATLAQHALFGAAYAAARLDVARPRVGLLSIGAEPGKGDRARRGADSHLRTSPMAADGRYVGLVEGHDVTLGHAADVVVTDGFTGNVLLKGIEGAYAMAGGPEPGRLAPRAATLLGVAGTVVICHGAATGADLASGIVLAADLHRAQVTASVARSLDDIARTLADQYEVSP